MNVFELLVEDLKRGVLLFIGMANMVVSGYKCMGWAYCLATQHIVVIGKWSAGLCGMGGLLFVLKRGFMVEELYAREKDAKEKIRRLENDLDKACHKTLVLRMNCEFHTFIINSAYDTRLCDVYNVFDEKMDGLIHKCHQLRVNKEIEFGKRGTL